jgi:hypothetical protein
MKKRKIKNLLEKPLIYFGENGNGDQIQCSKTTQSKRYSMGMKDHNSLPYFPQSSKKQHNLSPQQNPEL